MIAMNSTTSMRRSPPSYLATNDYGLRRRFATSCWVRPAFLRAAIMSSQRAFCPEEWTDLSLNVSSLRKAAAAHKAFSGLGVQNVRGAAGTQISHSMSDNSLGIALLDLE